MNKLKQDDLYSPFLKNPCPTLQTHTLMLFYQPIIGQTAISLYLTLYAEAFYSPKGMSFEHKRLLRVMKISFKEFQEAKVKLEQYNLITTFLNKKRDNHYYYQISSPRTYKELENSERFSKLVLDNLTIDDLNTTTNIINHKNISKRNLAEIKPIERIAIEEQKFTIDELVELIEPNELIKKLLNRNMDDKEEYLIKKLESDFNLTSSQINVLINWSIQKNGFIVEKYLLKIASTVYQKKLKTSKQVINFLTDLQEHMNNQKNQSQKEKKATANKSRISKPNAGEKTIKSNNEDSAKTGIVNQKWK